MKKTFDTLITIDDLVSIQNTIPLVILDCRYALMDSSFGRKEYMKSHIPGAHFMDVGHDLSSPVLPGITGRHPLPHPDVLASTLRASGVNPDTQVIVYDQSNAAFAARAWWLLRWLGHEKVAVLDGGFHAWLSRGLPVDNQWVQPEKGHFLPHPRPNMTVEARQLTSRQDQLIDSREFKRYTGETEPIDPVAGHIPGAICIPYTDNTNEHGYWKSKKELVDKFKLIRAEDSTPPVFYCGSGVTACHNILAYKIASGDDARLYPGSWSEWILHHPPVVGDQPG